MPQLLRWPRPAAPWSPCLSACCACCRRCCGVRPTSPSSTNARGAALPGGPFRRQRAWLAERVIEHPLLLDDLFDPRLEQVPTDRAAIAGEIARRLGTLDGSDTEAEIEVLQECKHSLGFRLGLAFRGGYVEAALTARRLARLAEAIVGAVLATSEREAVAQHGRLPGIGEGSGLAVLGYGSLGAAELGFASDLDLVFLYDGALAAAERRRASAGWTTLLRANCAKVVHLLTTLTRAGRLYEVDVRLRPDGGKGLLVASLQGFTDYQRERAWTWEHQALVRARWPAMFRWGAASVPRRGAGDAAGGGRGVRPGELHAPALAQRTRPLQRRRPRSEAGRRWSARHRVSALQALVLAHAAQHAALLEPTGTPELIAAAAPAGLLDAAQADVLHGAHGLLLARAWPAPSTRLRVVIREAALETATAGCWAWRAPWPGLRLSRAP